MPTEAEVLEARSALMIAGLHVRATGPLDWELAEKREQNPHLLRGGTHVEKTPDLNIVHGGFLVEWDRQNENYLVQGEAHPPKSFPTLREATAHVIRFWRPVGPKTPIRRG